MPKTKREIAREVDEFLAYSKYPGVTSKRPWPPPGVTYGTQWPTDRRYKLVDADTGKDMRDALDFEIAQIRASRHGVIPLDLRGGTYQVRLRDPGERFVVMDRNLRILGESKSVQGAMQKAPNDKSYAIVRGEYTSDGRYWGLGGGRSLAVREFQPNSGFRWHVG